MTAESTLTVLTSSPAARLMLYARALEGTEFIERGGKMIKISRGAKGRFGDMLDGPDLDAIIANPKSGDRERVKAHFMAMKTPELKAEARKRGAYIGDVSRKDQIADRIVQREIGHKLDSQAIQKGGWDDSSAWTRPAQMQLGAKAEPDLDKMTNPQLKELAKAEGIKGYSKMRKAELVQAIQGARASDSGGDASTLPTRTPRSFEQRSQDALKKFRAGAERGDVDHLTDDELMLAEGLLGRMNGGFGNREELELIATERGLRASRQVADAPTPTVGAKQSIQDAYAKLPKAPGGWVGLAALRAELADLSREDIDAALRKLATQKGVRLAPFDNTRALRPQDRTAALELGDSPKHMIAIDAPLVASPDVTPTRTTSGQTPAPTPAVGDADEARALARVGRPDDGSKLYQAQLRQARIDVVRPRAQLLAEMEEVFSIAEGSDQPDAVRRRFDGAVKALGLEGDPKIAPLDEALRRGDIEGFHAAVAEVAASSKLRRIGGDPKLGPDQAVTFDPKQHDSLVKGELRAGDKAMVVRPGYAADIGDQPGLVLEKAVVHKAPTVGKADAQPKPGTVAALQKEHEEWLATRDERAAQADAVNQRMASLASALRKHEGNNEGMLAALKAENLDTKQLKRLADELNIDIPPAAKSKSARERYITTTAAEYSRRNGGMSPTTGSRLPRNPETAANPKLSASKASDLSSISAELAAFRANPQRGDREKVASILKPLRHAQLDEIARQNGWELPKKATLPQKRTQLEEHLVGRRLSSNAIFSLKDRPSARTALGGGEQPTSTQDNNQLTDLRRQLANVEAAEVSEIDSRRAAGMRGEARELRRQIARIESGADEGTVDQPREKTRADIMAVYSQLVSRPGEILSLVKLRGNLPHIKHDELTEVLKQMDRERLIHLDPDPNTKAIPKAGHDAAIRLGGEDKHFITIR